MTRPKKSIAGRVTSVYSGAVMVTVDGVGDTQDWAGARVVLTREPLTDAEVGHRLRRVFASETCTRRQMTELANSIEDEAGWPILADLIREILDERHT